MSAVTLTVKSPGVRVTRDGRFTVTRVFDSSAGRGARVPRGWAVTDAERGGHRTTHASLERAREYLARATSNGG